MKNEHLKLNHNYATPSGMGGIFKVKYLGMSEGRYIFQVLNPGFKSIRLKESDLSAIMRIYEPDKNTN